MTLLYSKSVWAFPLMRVAGMSILGDPYIIMREEKVWVT